MSDSTTSDERTTQPRVHIVNLGSIASGSVLCSHFPLGLAEQEFDQEGERTIAGDIRLFAVLIGLILSAAGLWS